jgi:hypothetical protein
MPIDSTPQPCLRCLRPTVLVTRSWGREWIHVGTWRSQCGGHLGWRRPAGVQPWSPAASDRAA